MLPWNVRWASEFTSNVFRNCIFWWKSSGHSFQDLSEKKLFFCFRATPPSDLSTACKNEQVEARVWFHHSAMHIDNNTKSQNFPSTYWLYQLIVAALICSPKYLNQNSRLSKEHTPCEQQCQTNIRKWQRGRNDAGWRGPVDPTIIEAQQYWSYLWFCRALVYRTQFLRCFQTSSWAPPGSCSEADSSLSS